MYTVFADFAARLEKDQSVALPRETREEFIRVKDEWHREKDIEIEMHWERLICSK